MHVGLRHESADSYQQVIASSTGRPANELPRKRPFGQVAYVGDQNQVTRQITLEVQRTVALAQVIEGPTAGALEGWQVRSASGQGLASGPRLAVVGEW
jgi:hypothetical protein